MIIYDWPPNTDEETKKMKNVATAYRGNIYCPEGPVRDDIIIHEEVHLRQQGDDYDNWIAKYCSDLDFMIDQEVEAYREQLKFLEKTKGHSYTLVATVSFAKFLSSEVYGKVISLDEAIKRLQL